MQYYWWSFVALALAASCMDSPTDVSAVQQLPLLWQEGLNKHHAQLPFHGRALADDAWSVEEHAQILLQYMRPGAKIFHIYIHLHFTHARSPHVSRPPARYSFTALPYRIYAYRLPSAMAISTQIGLALPWRARTEAT